MATKRFLIEVEEGVSQCSTCPLDKMDGRCHYVLEILFNSTCQHLNLATMKIKEYEED
jgi:hypothetical protein